jgi:hypothetical protein
MVRVFGFRSERYIAVVTVRRERSWTSAGATPASGARGFESNRLVSSVGKLFLIDFITLHMLILCGAAQTEPFNRNQKAARRVVAAASQLALRV